MKMGTTIKRLAACAAIIAAIVASVRLPSVMADTTPAYKNPKLPIDARVADLLKRMTLEEKVAQMVGVWQSKPQVSGPTDRTDRGDFSPEKAAKQFPYGVGHIARQSEDKTPRGSAEFANSVQKWLVEKTRLGIPAIFHDEILHGNMARDSTVFPTPLSMASSWDLDLVHRVFTAGALETRVRGSQHVLGPNLDLARDARWGRTEETWGEDPYLTSRYAVTLVKALQGGATNEKPMIDADHVIATGKHFIGHGQPEGGTNIAPVNISERLLRETHLRTFEAAIKEGGLQSMMPAYHEIDGVPVHANKYFLDTILRGEFGFKGVVVSDYYAIGELATRHRVAVDKADAARQALAAGVDIELPDPEIYATIVDQVKSGLIPIASVDRAVARVLRSKFQTGLFENPYVDPARAEKIVDSAEHRELAREAAREWIVLLKNEKNTLPFDKSKLKSVAVIGPNAARAHLGGYTDPKPPKTVSLVEGVKAKVGPGVTVNYAEGVKITMEGGNWFADKSTPSDEATDMKLIAEAVATAKNSDAIILNIGGNEDTSKEAWADNHIGDRDTLELPGRQNELVRQILALGKPTAVLLTSSGPLAINYVAENAPAILEGFYLGEETGNAAADVIFGDYNPAGKLAISFPRSVGQLPAYYNRKPSSKRGYLYTSTDPIYPFGFGLSYTTFEYSDLVVQTPKIASGAEAKVTVKVRNTGSRRGDEIAQLYIRDDVSSVTRPIMELRDFARVSLEPGETKTVTFTLTPDKLSLINREMKRVVEPGTFTLMAGGDPNKLLKATLEVTK